MKTSFSQFALMSECIEFVVPVIVRKDSFLFCYDFLFAEAYVKHELFKKCRELLIAKLNAHPLAKRSVTHILF